MTGILIGLFLLVIAFFMKVSNDRFNPGDTISDMFPAIMAVFGIVAIVAGVFEIA